MGVSFTRRPEVESPVLVACWPGIGNIGVIAVDALREGLGAEEFGEIEPWDFFYPKKALIRNGELTNLEFPSSKFYFKRTERRDLMFFIGEEQPSEAGRAYAEGTKAYQMANLILDVALEFGCSRLYTSGAAVAPIHHSSRPRVWAVPNTDRLIDEVKGYENTVLMSEVEGRGGEGSITGLNGLLLGVARKRGLDAICAMGEIPVYLQGLPFPYPKASKSVLEVLAAALGVKIDMQGITAFAASSEGEIEKLYEMFPSEIRDQLDKLKTATDSESTGPGPITEEDKQKILEDIDMFFKREPRED
jgi:proteasome assembly chaperone (PAC2) family protein